MSLLLFFAVGLDDCQLLIAALLLPVPCDLCPSLSPYLAPFLRSHGCTGLAGKCFLKFRHVLDYSVHTILGRRVRIGLHHQAQALRRGITATSLAVADEEPLLRSKAVHRLGLLMRF